MIGKPRWEVVIGLETHVQLSTASKIFSGASTAFGVTPNSQASAVDIALPGVLPVLNKGAVERAIRFGLAVGGAINRRSVFARKNYFYPDLPKGYQISQYEIPVVQGGSIAIVSSTRGEMRVTLARAHLEEDAGKSLHEGIGSHGVLGGSHGALGGSHGALGGSHAALGRGMTGIDLNRAGTPLLEVVSEPDMRSAEEAIAYAKSLHSLVRWIDICDGNMQEGSFRCDANVSVRLAGESRLGTRCEIKNLNSFRFMHQAIEFEVRRQIELIEDGGAVVQETRLYDPDRGETRSMRSKEDAQDYRYFPDPDLPPLVIDGAWIDRIQSEIPELPEAMARRFVVAYDVPVPEAAQLTLNRETARYFEATVQEPAVVGTLSGKAAANWILGEISARLNRDGIEIEQAPVQPAVLARLLARIQDNTISGSAAKDVLDAMWAGENAGDPDAIIAAKGLQQISDAGAIEKIVQDVLAANAATVAEYTAGKEKAFNSLVGKVMAATRGKANPAQVNAALKRKLTG
ncbi:MAG: Asp-tRNA(Asn)/Glu-tRNA(Gln) amidotransferase subunit GatB [Pseudomonadota bacterium]|nr:Asp-tRNA(Asn)/Glu-tRNA(Gln) amidotransferase subunit GatB [Pseudomonadota bacterium]